MMEPRSAWLRERRGLWVSGAVALLVGLAALGVYQGFFAGRAELLVRRIDGLNADLAELAARREELDGMYATATRRDADIAELYEVRLGTEKQRFTRFITEVKDLAREAGMDPTTLSYPTEALEGYGLIERAAVFSVEGSYGALRQFLNFLELSDSFLIVRRLALGEQAGDRQRLSIRVEISTLFSDPDTPSRRRAVSRSRPVAEPAPAVSADSERQDGAADL